jgi:alpha-tubulin suppressor-like RCC1 family protein
MAVARVYQTLCLCLGTLVIACGRINFDPGRGPGGPAVPRTIAAGHDFTCSVEDGELACWGGNAFGQLGNGTTDRSLTPSHVDIANVVEVEAGAAHACARDVEGSVWCWGDNQYRQVGDGTMTASATPVRVTRLPAPAIDIGLGAEHSCAVLEGGNVWCWGDNEVGQCGTGEPSGDKYIDPTRALIGNVDEIVGGGQRRFTEGHTCVRRYGDELWCWGSNYHSQHFAEADSEKHPYPRDTGIHVRALGAGAGMTCVALLDGHFACSGVGYSGAVGGTSIEMPSAVGDIVAIEAGMLTGCAITGAGDAMCWGVADRGQRGDGTARPYSGQLSAVQLAGPATEIAVGSEHACALLVTGELQCWGSGRAGQLGDGRGASSTPVKAMTPTAASVVGPGYESTCMTDALGAVWCWGVDLIDGSFDTVPQQVAGLPAASGRVGMGEEHACVLAGGDVWCWGANQYDQLGGPGGGSLPRVAFTGANELVAGAWFSCAIRAADSTVWCWGSNDYGVVPTADGSLGQIDGVAFDLGAGDRHVCQVRLDNTVWCWGENSRGQLGVTGIAQSATPLQIAGVTGSNNVVAGGQHACSAGSLGMQCWGDDGTSRGVRSPAELVPAPTAAMGAGGRETCSVDGAGSVECWGNNTWGQIGDGTSIRRDDPTPVIGEPASVAVDVGGGHACAHATDNSVWCWGDNDKGQLGNGTMTAALVPVTVPR